MACRSVPLADLDDTVGEIAAAVAANSQDSLAAYRDLFAVAESSGLDAGLAYEAATTYEIADTDDRLASFRA